MKFKRALVILFLSAILAGGLFSGCGGKKTAPPKPPVPVSVAPALQKDIPLILNAIGNVEPYASIAVKSQVEGELVAIHFQEGQMVKKGQSLFTIDPQPFDIGFKQAQAGLEKDQAQMKQAKANLARDLSQVNLAKANLEKDKAQEQYARSEAERYRSLQQQGFASQQEYEQYNTNAKSLQAQVKASQAALENAAASSQASRAAVENASAQVQVSAQALANARIKLGYCAISSPIDGRAGAFIVQAGNLIKANDSTPLTVINQVEPIFVSFALPEKYLSDIRRYSQAGSLQVRAEFEGENKAPEIGKLSFIDNAVDPNTGTIKLKAVFPNRGHRLWPGQFINVSLVLTVLRQALVVPSQAVQTGQKGTYVFTVNPDKTAKYREVKTGEIFGNYTVIESGLTAGDTVVTEGQLRLVTGSAVEMAQPASSASPGEASPQASGSQEASSSSAPSSSPRGK